MDIAILLYDNFTALDAVGPYEVLSRLPGATLSFVAKQTGPVTADTGALSIVATKALDELPHPEIVLVPGGPGDEKAAADPEIRAWVRTAHETTKWTTSVCTGSIILAEAGVLDGLEATTHWASYERLAARGAKPTKQRVVRQGKVMTAAGVSSGIDMALTLVQLELGDDFAQALQLGIEYDPQPPFDAGSPDKAPQHIVDLVLAHAAATAR